MVEWFCRHRAVRNNRHLAEYRTDGVSLPAQAVNFQHRPPCRCRGCWVSYAYAQRQTRDCGETKRRPNSMAVSGRRCGPIYSMINIFYIVTFRPPFPPNPMQDTMRGGRERRKANNHPPGVTAHTGGRGGARGRSGWQTGSCPACDDHAAKIIGNPGLSPASHTRVQQWCAGPCVSVCVWIGSRV